MVKYVVRYVVSDAVYLYTNIDIIGGNGDTEPYKISNVIIKV